MIVIIPCGSAKLDKPAVAWKLYTGGYFRALLRYALSIAPAEQIYILSAKYGLLALTDAIKPYNLKMGQPGSITVEQVHKQAEARGLLDASVIALGGRLYTSVCRGVWPMCSTPLDGIGGMGKQIRWTRIHRGQVIREETS